MMFKPTTHIAKLRRILGIATNIAEKAHEGQERWDGEPYITHPKYVANKFNDVECKIVAILHDVIEDTDVGVQDLIKVGIPDSLIGSIIAITKIDCEDYKHYILRVKDDEIATKVKIEDLRHNTSDLKKGSMRDKYLLSLYILGVRE